MAYICATTAQIIDHGLQLVAQGPGVMHPSWRAPSREATARDIHRGGQLAAKARHEPLEPKVDTSAVCQPLRP